MPVIPSYTMDKLLTVHQRLTQLETVQRCARALMDALADTHIMHHEPAQLRKALDDLLDALKASGG